MESMFEENRWGGTIPAKGLRAALEELLPDNLRFCDVCGRPFTQGYRVEGAHYCSEECMDRDPGYSAERFREDYEEAEKSGGVVYWSDWAELGDKSPGAVVARYVAADFGEERADW